MALTSEQEKALLALLDEPLITLNELPKATNIEEEDLFLIHQDMIEKAITTELIKNHFSGPATLDKSGIVQLSNDLNSNSETKAATPKAIKQ